MADDQRAALDAQLRPMFEVIHAYQESLVREVRQQAIREAIAAVEAQFALPMEHHSLGQAVKALLALREAAPARQEEG